VPFLVKLAGQDKGLVYAQPLKTLLTRDMIVAILNGEIRKPEQLVDWFRKR
jgi:hypothetical protein